MASRFFAGIGILLLIGLRAMSLAAVSDATGHLGEGLRLFGLERYTPAAREFELALAADPNLDDARYHLAVCYFNEHQYTDARSEFKQLEASGFRWTSVTYYLGRLDLLDGRLNWSIRRLTTVARNGPLQDELYYLGSAYMKKDEPERAIQVLKQQIRVNPRDFRAHYLLAQAYLKTGHREEAKREFQEEERLHQYYLSGKEDLMECRKDLSSGKVDQAWARCGSVLATDDFDKLIAVGMLFGEFNSYNHALAAFQKALSLDPDAPEVNYDMGYTYYRKKDYAQAVHFLKIALTLRPDFFEALEVYGAALHAAGNNAEARTTLSRAHQLRPDDAAVNRLLTEINSKSAK